MSELSTKVELQPFMVPSFVRAVAPPRPRSEGIVEATMFALNELSIETLDALCLRFRDDVMRKAGKIPPSPTAGPDDGQSA